MSAHTDLPKMVRAHLHIVMPGGAWPCMLLGWVIAPLIWPFLAD
jgi:hypothetical protein